MENRICKECSQEKFLDEQNFRLIRKEFKYICRDCETLLDKQAQKQWRENNPNYKKEYRKNNKEKLKIYQDNYELKNKDRIKEYRRKPEVKERRNQKSKIKRKQEKINRSSIEKIQKLPIFTEFKICIDCKECFNLNTENFRIRIRIKDCFFYYCFESVCKNCENKQFRLYAKNNPEKIKLKQERRKNDPKQKFKAKEYVKNKKLNDPTFKIRTNISIRIWECLKKNFSSKQKKSILNYLPYTIQELKNHLESLFEPWMNWNNWGPYNSKTWDDNDCSTWTWQIDHIIPASLFKYTSMEDEEFKKCWSLDNLRPLNSKENLLDGAKRTRHKQI